MRRQTALAAVAVVLIATALFSFGMTFGLDDRFRGDAREYYTIGVLGGLDDLLQGARRTLGFPLLLRVESRAYELLGFVVERSRPEGFVNAVVVQLFLFHLACSLGFVWSLDAWSARFRTAGYLRAGWALPIVAHPALVLHSTVPLTDTFCADLVMLAFAALLREDARDGSAARTAALGAVAGLLLGYASLVRPTYVAPTIVLLGVFTAYRQLAVIPGRRPVGLAPGRTSSQRLLLLVPLGVLALLLGTAAGLCAGRHGRPCLQNPAVVSEALRVSGGMGRDSARMYYSRLSSAAEGRVVVRDPFLSEHWAMACPHETAPPFRGLAACVVERPHVALAVLVKKAAGLVDAYHLQPYAVDLTPAWFRWLSRLFNALAFVGLVACAVLVVSGLRRGREAGVAVGFALFTLVYVASHGLGHVEGRYGFGALPGAYFGLCRLAPRLSDRAAPRARRAAFGALAVAAVVWFVGQTSAWDRLDPYLARIEGGAVSRGTSALDGAGRAAAHNARGLDLVARGRPDDARAEFEAAIRSDPAFVAAHNNLGNHHFRLGRFAEAADAYRAALRLDPGQAHAHNNLGSVYFRTGQLELAEAQYRRALELDPRLDEVRRNLDVVVRVRAGRSGAPAGR